MALIEFDSTSTSDPTNALFVGLAQTKINLMKEVLEDFCIDLGETNKCNYSIT